jgi:ABC-type uncharacterized transport system permease subunit
VSPWLANPAFYVAALLYGLAGAALLAHLAGTRRQVPVVWGLRFLSAAAVLHGLHEALGWADGRGPFSGIRESLSTLALLVVVAFLGVRRVRQRVEVVGAFVAPLTLLMLLASRAPAGRPVGHLGGALIALHVGSVLTGTAAFTVAFAMALAYLIQERQVKRKHLKGVFQRLPPLDVLDDLGYRCVAVGLPALTLGIVTGLFVGVRTSTGGPLAAWQQYVGMGAWIVFAGVLVLRLAAGWRGRRAALGTILGYASAVLVLAGYYLRSGRP